jgi:hypothetical protein
VKRTYDEKASCGRCKRWQKSPEVGLSWCELCGAQWSAGGRAYEYFLPRHRWPLVVVLIAIAAVLVLAACLVWAVIDPAHNPPKRGEVPVHYTDFVLKEDEGWSCSRVMDGIIYLDVAGLRIKNVTIWGFGTDGTVYAAQNDKPVKWFGGVE